MAVLSFSIIQTNFKKKRERRVKKLKPFPSSAQRQPKPTINKTIFFFKKQQIKIKVVVAKSYKKWFA